MSANPKHIQVMSSVRAPMMRKIWPQNLRIEQYFSYIHDY